MRFNYFNFQFSLQVLKWLGGKQELLKEAHLQVDKQSIIKMQYNLYGCMKCQTIKNLVVALCVTLPEILSVTFLYLNINLNHKFQNLTKNSCGHLYQVGGGGRQ